MKRQASQAVPATVGTKLRPPSLPGERLERRELIARLDTALSSGLALLCAPAGYGKTWLVADWLGYHSEQAQVWVSLDQADNDPARFWLHVVEGIRDGIVDPGLSRGAFGGGVVDIDRVVDEVLIALGECEEDVILVLDDVHVLEDPTALGSLDRVLVSLPPNVSLVLAARHDPMLRLGRLRVGLELVELRAEHLRLTLDEAIRLVEAMIETPVSEPVVEQLLERTGGWIAAVRLTALDLSRRAHPNLMEGWDVQVIGDYLVSEVLANLEPTITEFLLETSVLEQLSGELCDAVTSRDDSAAQLEWLVDKELFTVRTGVGWYRYHELFRELLQVELRRAHPDLVPELHRRAGEWLFDHGDPVAAVRHALAAGEWDIASDWLVASSGRLFVNGQMATVLALGKLIDDAVSEVPLPVAGTMAVAGIFSGLPGSEIDRLFARFQDRIAADMERIPASGSAWDWPGFVFRFHHDPQELYATIRAVTAQRAGDFESIMDQAAHIPTEAGFVEATVGRVLTWREQYSEAEPLLDAFLGSMSSPRNPLLHSRARAKGLIALAWVGEGRLSEVEELVFQVRDELRAKSLDEIRPVPDVLLAHAQVAWERGALAAAEQAAAEALRGASHLGEMASFALAVILMSRILSSRGDRSGADEALDQGAVMPPGHPVPGHIRERLDWERSRLALNDGDLVGAEIAVPDWRERMGRGATAMREHLLLARFAIAAGEDASALLDQPPPRCQVTVSHRIQLGLLKSLAAVARGVRDDALDELTMAMEIAAHTGHRQRFLDERPTLGALLDNAAARAGISLQSGVADDVVVIDLRSSPPASDDRAGDLESIRLLDPLTGRELDVLRLLPSHRSYAAIADELGLTINTVKYHVKAIYRKLNATSRTEAVDKAQRCGLLTTSA